MDGFHGTSGRAGWQWVFLIEALPAILLGVAVFFFLDNGIKDAKWLSAGEKDALSREIAREESTKETRHPVASVFRDLRVWHMSFIYFCVVMGHYALTF